ncbi:MAG: FixH family protein [Campylobacterota bacterium]
MNLSNGRIWPYAIGGSIILIFGACVATVIVANKLPVEASDTYMMGYHQADASANDLIKAQIAFNKSYKIEYITDGLSVDGSVLKYRVSDIYSNPVNDARLKVVVTRPNNHKHDQELINPRVENGVYTFSSITLPQEGRWDVMAKVNVGQLQRFYNVKADTRAKEAFEY